MKFFLDTIKGLVGHQMSGLWTLIFESGRTAYIESGHGVRTLSSAFGATEGAGNLMERIKGQQIVWSLDDMGLCMGSFTPMDQWTGPCFGEDGVIEWDPEADVDPTTDPNFLVEVIHTAKRPGPSEEWRTTKEKVITVFDTLQEVHDFIHGQFGERKTRKKIFVNHKNRDKPWRIGTIFCKWGSEIKGTGRRARIAVRDWVSVFELQGHNDDGQPEYEYKPILRLSPSK